ncbi:MAG: DUF58 domain-containing protein [Chloroflexi bacterium]|nr:DUF58 domain-containing protein [Chloroflexota bacterium]
MRLPFRRIAHSTESGRGSARTDGAPGSIPPEMLARVKAIEIKARRLVNDLFLGEYHAVFRGRGLEFDELRPYVPGDDVRSIDWKAMARTGQPSIRRYREDRDLTVVFVVDVSASQGAGSLERTKEDLAAELCAVLALAAIRNKDKVGLLLFASRPERYVRPSGGTTHVLRVVREVLWAQPATRGTDIGAALEYLTGVQKRRATVFLVSDFLATGFTRQMRAAARRHDIIAIRVREPIDEALPNAGVIRLADAETGRPIDVDTGSAAVREAYAQHVRGLDDERKRLFGSLGIDEIAVNVDQDYVPALLRFFKRRGVAAAG